MKEEALGGITALEMARGGSNTWDKLHLWPRRRGYSMFSKETTDMTCWELEEADCVDKN